MNALWTLTCGNCNTTKLGVTVPDEWTRNQVLPHMKAKYPNWTFFPTKCPACQTIGLELKWTYRDKKHRFDYEAGGVFISGELYKQTPGRRLVLTVTKDGKTSRKRYDCLKIADGKELAKKLVKNISGG